MNTFNLKLRILLRRMCRQACPKLTVPLFAATGNLVLSTGRPLNGGAAHDSHLLIRHVFLKNGKSKEIKMLTPVQRNHSSCPRRKQNICQRSENWNHHARPAKMALPKRKGKYVIRMEGFTLWRLYL